MEERNRQLTVDEVVSDGGAIAEAIVIDVATLAVEVFSDGHQIANGGGCADVGEVLSSPVLQANLSKGFPPIIHDADLRVEVLDVCGVYESGLDVDFWIYQCPVPKFGELIRRVETIDQTWTEWRGKQEGGGNEER